MALITGLKITLTDRDGDKGPEFWREGMSVRARDEMIILFRIKTVTQTSLILEPMHSADFTCRFVYADTTTKEIATTEDSFELCENQTLVFTTLENQTTVKFDFSSINIAPPKPPRVKRVMIKAEEKVRKTTKKMAIWMLLTMFNDMFVNLRAKVGRVIGRATMGAFVPNPLTVSREMLQVVAMNEQDGSVVLEMKTDKFACAVDGVDVKGVNDKFKVSQDSTVEMYSYTGDRTEVLRETPLFRLKLSMKTDKAEAADCDMIALSDSDGSRDSGDEDGCETEVEGEQPAFKKPKDGPKVRKLNSKTEKRIYKICRKAAGSSIPGKKTAPKVTGDQEAMAEMPVETANLLAASTEEMKATKKKVLRKMLKKLGKSDKTVQKDIEEHERIDKDKKAFKRTAREFEMEYHKRHDAYYNSIGVPVPEKFTYEPNHNGSLFSMMAEMHGGTESVLRKMKKIVKAAVAPKRFRRVTRDGSSDSSSEEEEIVVRRVVNPEPIVVAKKKRTIVESDSD